MSRVVWWDLADPEESVHVVSTLGYIEGHVESQRRTMLITDSGPTVDLIDARFVMKRQIP